MPFASSPDHLEPALGGRLVPNPHPVDRLHGEDVAPEGELSHPSRRCAALPVVAVELADEAGPGLFGRVVEAEDDLVLPRLEPRPEGDRRLRGDEGEAAVAPTGTTPK